MDRTRRSCYVYNALPFFCLFSWFAPNPKSKLKSKPTSMMLCRAHIDTWGIITFVGCRSITKIRGRLLPLWRHDTLMISHCRSHITITYQIFLHSSPSPSPTSNFSLTSLLLFFHECPNY